MAKVPEKFDITLKDKPNLRKAFEDNPQKMKEVIATFVSLMEESFDQEKGIPWVDLPEKFGCTFPELIKGILRGSLDLKGINPDTFDAIKEELHPLSMLAPRKNKLTGGLRHFNWRGHFRLPEGTPVNEETIQEIFKKLLRYGKYINFTQLYEAIQSNPITAYKSLSDKQIELLPFIPALRYQKEHFGDLHVGKMFTDIGAFDCGDWKEGYPVCLACEIGDDPLIHLQNHVVCPRCNAGFYAPAPDHLQEK